RGARSSRVSRLGARVPDPCDSAAPLPVVAVELRGLRRVPRALLRRARTLAPLRAGAAPGRRRAGADRRGGACHPAVPARRAGADQRRALGGALRGGSGHRRDGARERPERAEAARRTTELAAHMRSFIFTQATSATGTAASITMMPITQWSVWYRITPATNPA